MIARSEDRADYFRNVEAREALSERIEAALNIAAEADAEVARLLAEFDALLVVA